MSASRRGAAAEVPKGYAAYGIHCSPCLSNLEKRTMKRVWPRDDDGFIAVGRTVRLLSPTDRSDSAVA